MVVEVNATSVHTFAVDNSIMITDKSGDSIELKGLSAEQLDSMAANWLRDRIRQDRDTIQKDRDFRLTILQTDLNNLWPAESAVWVTTGPTIVGPILTYSHLIMANFNESWPDKYTAIADCSDAISQLIVIMDNTSIISELNEHVDREDLNLNDYGDLRNYLSRLSNLIPDLQCKYKLQDAGLCK